jgi:hypothetical protein
MDTRFAQIFNSFPSHVCFFWFTVVPGRPGKTAALPGWLGNDVALPVRLGKLLPNLLG